MKSEFKKRLLTSIILLPAVSLIIFYNQHLFIFLLIVILFFSSKEWFCLNKNKINTTTILGFIFVILSVIFAYLLRGEDMMSIILFFWLILIGVFSDLGGYVFGKTFGGKKITRVSPNKTYAGMYGSFIFSLFPSAFFYLSNIKIFIYNYNTETYFLFYISLTLLLSLICQIGDLTVSYFKRQNNFKDTGNILPGHGGLLDRIDGILFVIFFAGLLKIFGII